MADSPTDTPLEPSDANEDQASATPTPSFFGRFARIVNSRQSPSIVLAGQIHDLFYSSTSGEDGAFVSLLEFLCDRCRVPGLMLLVYELNGPIRLLCHGPTDEGWDRLRRAWVSWKAGMDHDRLILKSLTDRHAAQQRESLEAEFDRRVHDVIGQPTVALELLRQLTLCSRARFNQTGASHERLLVFVEAADLMLPVGRGDISSLSAADRHRVAIVQDWFADPSFLNGPDTVVLLAESASLIHPRVSKLPSVLNVEVEPPDQAMRGLYIRRFLDGREQGPASAGALDEPPPPRVELRSDREALAQLTAGLSIHALRQMLLAAQHESRELTPTDVIEKVESYIGPQLGEDVVEFKKPSHRLDDVIGASRLKAFLSDELIPRFRAQGDAALPGAAVAGPIGGGKTYIFEAVAAELGLPVLVLKNIRSQWFGQTDVVFERLRRVLTSLGKVVIFVDEADTQFGGVGAGTHDTERRLTGKVQQMMSDPTLRGRVIWLLMTARIEQLSPDIRRPGRVGDLIIPVLDPAPKSEDRKAFLRWALEPAFGKTIDDDRLAELDPLITFTSAAAFAALRGRLKAEQFNGKADPAELKRILYDQLPPNIASARRRQTLQAMLNCTRRSLLPDPDIDEAQRNAWADEIARLDARPS
ncbi:MAG: AAA family ATPase [Planctomycetota bacterium]